MAESKVPYGKTQYTLQSGKTLSVNTSDKLVVLFGGAGNAPPLTNSVYGFVVIAAGNSYGVLHKGSSIDVSVSNNTATITSPINQTMGYIEFNKA